MTTVKLESFISAGPGRSDLMFALFDGKTVTFTLSDASDSDFVTHTVITNTTIFSVEAEDGSRKRWNIKGQMYLDGHENDVTKFDGNYNSNTRRGTAYIHGTVNEISEMLSYGELRQYKVKTPNR